MSYTLQSEKKISDGLKTDKSLENSNVTIANDDTSWKHYSKTFVANSSTQNIIFGQFPNSTDAGQQLVTQYKNLQLIDADQTPPDAPTASKVYPTSTTVTGKTEAGAKISVKVNGTEIGTSTANAYGDYTVTIPVQVKDAVLTITAQDAAGNISDTTQVTVKEEVFAVAKPQTFILGTDISTINPKEFLTEIKNNGTNMKIEYVTKAATDQVGISSTSIKVTDLSTQIAQTIVVPTTIQFGDTLFSAGLGIGSSSGNRGISAVTIHHGEHPYLTNTPGIDTEYAYGQMHSDYSTTYYSNKLMKVTDEHELGAAYFDKSSAGTGTVSDYLTAYGQPSVDYGDIIEVYQPETRTFLTKPTATTLDGAENLKVGYNYFEITPNGYKQVLQNNITTKNVTINTGDTVKASDFINLPADASLKVADAFVQAPNLSKVGASTVQVEVDQQLNSGKYLKRTFTSTLTVKDTIAPTADVKPQTLDKGASIPAASTFLTNVHDNADADVANNISISYVTPPTTATIGVRTTQIAIQDKAGNKTIKDVTYSIKDENTNIQDNYMLHNGDVQLNTSDLEGKTSDQVASLLRQQAKIQGWDTLSGADLTDQITLESPVPTTSGTYTLIYKLGTVTAVSRVEIKDNTTFGFTKAPSALEFNTTEIKSSEATIDREETGWNIGVTDARNNGDKWAVTATVNGPLENMTDPTAKKTNERFHIYKRNN
ncbi:Ig-like domain-containing protein [Listeria cornellensis]|nr:Ig-like domain-containing protein [Listeria cornellensis]